MPGDRDWTEEERHAAIEAILTGVASGMSVDRCLRELDDMPSSSLFWGKWHRGDEQLQSDLARAREAGVEVHLEEAMDIAEQSPGTYATENGVRVDPGEIAHRKLQIETRIKRAQMIAPRKYGPKLDLTTGGDKIGNPADAAPSIASLLAEAEKRKDARTKT